MAVTLAAGDNKSVRHSAILNMHILDIFLEHIKCRDGFNVTLNKVCGVKYALYFAFEGCQNFKTAFCSVAVNFFFILMTAENAVFISVIGHYIEAFKHFIAVYSGVIAVRNKEAEHTDILRPENMCIFDTLLECFKMLLKVLGNLNLAEARADCGNTDIVFIENFLYILCLLCREIRNISVVKTSGFNMRKTVGFKCLNLT